MPKKKKKKKQQSRAAVKQEIAEEILALEAIYADDFSLHDDGIGFQLLVVPHPGYHGDNHCSVELHVRYTAGYPGTPLQLKLRNQVGLSSDDVRQLSQQLSDTAAQYAQDETVCVFNLVDDCQEFLRAHNAAAAEAQALAAAAAANADAEASAAASSLWHEMQQRQQAEAAARESEVSVGPGLQGPGGILGVDLWMFDGGLFAEEGVPSFAVPNLNSQQQQGPKGRRQPKASALRPDVSPEPLHRLATSPQTPSMMHKARGLAAAGKSPNVSTPGKPPAGQASTAAAGGLKAAAAMAGVSLLTPQQKAQGAGAAEASAAGTQEQQQTSQAQQQQEPQRQGEDAMRQQEQAQEQSGGLAGGRVGGLKLLLSHSHSCSFSNLPRGLQQLLNSGDGTHKRRKSRHRHKQRMQPGQAQPALQEQDARTDKQQGPAAKNALQASSRVESLVFGDIDSSVYRRLSSDSAPEARHSQAAGSSRAAAPAAAGAATAVGSETGFGWASSGDGSGSESDSSSSTSRRVSASGAATDKQRSMSEESETAEEEEGPSLRSQLLLGHLLLLASGAVSGPSAAVAGVPTDHADGSTVSISAADMSLSSAAPGGVTGLQGLAGGSSSSGSMVMRPAGLQVLAGHLRRSGLLPKWVYWLLRQLPQRPELYERAFNRLFQQEIQETSTAEDPDMSPQQQHPSQVLKLFWDRQAAAAAAAAAASTATLAPGASTATAPTVTSSDAASLSFTATGLQGVSAGMRMGSGAAAAAAAAATAAAATLGQQQQLAAAAAVSRYRSDFQELNRLGQGGFGVVVAAVNRLDGRKYAVKKIRLQPGGSSSSYSRILREVATLSRLQHPNVVRYYQAWTEQAQQEDADVDAEPSEGGEWGDLSDSEEESTESEDEPSGAQDDSTLTHQEASTSFAPTSTVFSSCTTAEGSSSGSDGSSSDDSSSSEDGSEAGLFGDPSISIPPHLPVPLRRSKPRKDGKVPHSPAQPKVKSSSGGKRRSRPAGPSQILYIQMEFCPRTLAQVLEAGSLEEADAWLVLRGILAGLAHIHSQGAIHRDLKPANIFYDSKGEVKLGDFGLAKFQAQQSRQAEGGEPGATGSPRLSAQQRLSSMGGAAAMSAAAPSDVTGICGTGYYISPEIANGWASYDEKVDLYSLGVVVFEMWHPFSTAMERAVLLRELREAGKLPPAWEAAHPQVARLIRWVMSPKPADRPSARQVLTSDLLPPRLEDEQLKDLLRSLPDNEIAYERVVDSLFSISTSREPQTAGFGSSPTKGGSGGGGTAAAGLGGPAAAASRAVQSLTPARAATGVEGLHGAGLLASQQGALPLGELPGAPVDAHLDKEEDVVKVVKEVAGLHGAVQMSSADLGLSHLGLPRDAVRFLAPSGAVIALRYEVRYPLAAWFAQQAALAASGSSGGYYSNGFGSSGLGLGGGAFGAASTLEHGLKRFEVCRVQRAGRSGRGLPASYLTADFDIISPSGVGTGGAGRERLLAEAEVVKVVTQVLDALPELGSYEIRLGHTQILSAALTGMALPPGVSPASVMALLASAAAVSAAHSSSEGTSSGGATPGHTSGSTGTDAGAPGATGSHSTAGQAAPGSLADAGGSGGASGGGAAGRLHRWPAIRVGLDGLGLDSTPVSRCRQCVLQLPGPLFSQLTALRSFIRELRPQLGSAGTTAALTACDELQALGQLLMDWGVGRDQLLLEPLLTPQAEYFSGTLFQVLLQSHSHHGYHVVHTSAVAAGGRYDALLRSLWSPAAAALMPAPGAVGVTLNCEKLVKMLSALQRRQQARAGGLGAAGGSHGTPAGPTGLLLEGGGRQPGSQCDVLVCARGGDGRLQMRMTLLAQLWAAGISAQMLPREGPSLAEQYEYADACGAKWLVIIDDKTTNPAQGLVRVKRWRRGPDDATGSSGRLRRGEDSSVHVSDLARFLQLGLSGAQDPGREMGGLGGSGASAAAGAVGSGSGHLHYRSLLHRSGSGGDLRGSRGAVESSLDSYESGVMPESIGGREGREGYLYREGGGGGEGRRERERAEQQGGRHRDRRR